MKTKELILKKYCESKQIVHINHTCGKFFNGVISEVNPEEELIILDELKLGEMFLEFNEIQFPISLFIKK